MHKQLLLILLFINVSIFTMDDQQLDHLKIAYLDPEPTKPHLQSVEPFSHNLDPRLVDMCISQAPDNIKRLVGKLNTQHNFPQPVHTLLVGKERIGKKTLACAIAQKTQTACIKIDLDTTKSDYLYALHDLLLSTINPLFGTQEQTIVILDKLEYVLTGHHTVYGPIPSDGDQRTAVIVDATESLDRFEDIQPLAIATPAEVLFDLLSFFKNKNKKNIIFIGTALAPEYIEPTIYQQFEPVSIDLPTYEKRKQSLLYQFARLREMTSIQIELDNKQLETLAARTQGFNHFYIEAIRKRIILNLLSAEPTQNSSDAQITFEDIRRELQHIQKNIQPCYIRTSNYAKDHWKNITVIGSAIGAGTTALISFLRK